MVNKDEYYWLNTAGMFLLIVMSDLVLLLNTPQRCKIKPVDKLGKIVYNIIIVMGINNMGLGK